MGKGEEKWTTELLTTIESKRSFRSPKTAAAAIEPPYFKFPGNPTDENLLYCCCLLVLRIPLRDPYQQTRRTALAASPRLPKHKTPRSEGKEQRNYANSSSPIPQATRTDTHAQQSSKASHDAGRWASQEICCCTNEQSVLSW